MKKTIIAFSIFIMGALAVNAQTKTYTGIKKFYGNGIRPIIENNEVRGYFMFGLADKVNKNENLYQILILDNNLNETHSIELKKSSKLALIESAYNGERFCFSFIDYKAKCIEYLLFDKEGKEAGAYKVVGLSDSEISLIEGNLSDDSNSGGLVAVEGKGFVRYGIEKLKGTKIEIEMFDNSGKKKWTANSGIVGKSYEGALPYYSDSNVVVSSITTRERLMSAAGADGNLVFHDVKKGKELFRIPMLTVKYGFLPEGVSFDESTGGYFIYGEYTKPKDIESIGFYIQSVDKKGLITKESYMTWTGDIFKATPGEIKSKEVKNMHVAIHKMIRTADGNFFAIGEQFRKAVDAGGMAMKAGMAVLGGLTGGIVSGNSGASAFKMELHNMMVYKFNNTLNITNVYMFEKDKTNVSLPQGIGLNGPVTLGYYLRATGQFNYAFSSVSADRKTFDAAYVNYDRDKEEGNKFVVGNIVYNKEQKLVMDKVDISSKATSHWVMQAKPGYVCIFEYFKKAKKVEIRLEKLNI